MEPYSTSLYGVPSPPPAVGEMGGSMGYNPAASMGQNPSTPIAPSHASPVPANPASVPSSPPVTQAHSDSASGTVPRIPVGTPVIGGYPVPEAMQHNPQFLNQPEAVQIYILQEIHAGRLAVSQPTVVSQTVRKTVRLYNGQWEALGKLVEECLPYDEDRRRSVTENTFLRQMVSLFLGLIRPHMELADVSDEAGVRRAMERAFTRAAQSSVTGME